MGTTSARTSARLRLTTLRALLSSLLVLGVALSAVTVPAAPAQAAHGKAVGQVIGTQDGKLRTKMLWFDEDWGYLGQRRLDGTIYSLSLPPGTYHLQFVDLRPAYDVTKYAPSDVSVTVRSGQVVQRDVRMRRGAAITGTVRAGGRPASGARVVAANTHEQSFEVKADRKGRFAVAGLPAGSYSVFTYDRGEAYVGRSTWVPGLALGKAANVPIALTKRGGSLLVQLRKADGSPMGGSFHVTVVSKASGQFWTVRARRGEVSFPNLFPGRYRMVAPGVGSWFARSGDVSGAAVKSGRADLASTFRWTKRGAWVSGVVVDEADGETPMVGAQVLLLDQAGRRLDETATRTDGSFTLDGQVPTQSGLQVVVNPSGGGWMAGVSWCRFESVTSGPWSVVAGRERWVDAITLPHAPAETVQCAV
ncbi:MSCRAMM family protein [Nocardioides sp. SYSU DS0663]|uniref:MSCRAMM family protein n=1 Tax=Nocardioides sp. SYSU DS0663 TaxID=3416445 RepID=UPI003F4B2D08